MNQNTGGRGLLRHDGNEWHVKRLADEHIGHVVCCRCGDDDSDEDRE